MEMPNIKLQLKGKSSYIESTCELRKTFTSPVLEQYEKMAAKYKNYIHDLSPKIQRVCEKENYRSYLKEQKLNMIKSHLSSRKEDLQRQLEEKLDPIKSPNGKLHTEIISLTELETNYSTCLTEIQKNISEKQNEIISMEQLVANQKSIIKGLFKYDFKLIQQKSPNKLPRIARNASQSSLWSRNSEMSNYKHSRDSIISKLGENIMDRTNRKLNIQQEKLIMLKLFIVYYRSEAEQSQLGSKLIESLQNELSLRQELIKELKKELSDIQLQKRSSFNDKLKMI